MRQIVEVLHRAEQGTTRPFVCRCDDGETWFVKGRDANRRSLVCEWISGHLGRALNLPVPEFEAVYVPEELMELAPVMSELADLGAGPAFGSKLAMGVELTASAVVHVPPELQRDVLAFDWWIRNADRTLSDKGGNPNLLWQAQTQQLVVIDHNLAFDEQFEVGKFLQSHVFHAEVQGLWGDMLRRETYTERFSKVLARTWSELALDMPPEWLFLDMEMTNPVPFRLDEFKAVLARCMHADFWSAS